MLVNLEVVFITTLCVKQEAQLSQRDRAGLYVIEYFAKSLKITKVILLRKAYVSPY